MKLKEDKVSIGKKEFTLVEMTCFNRDILLDLIGSFSLSNIMGSVLPVLETLGSVSEEDKEEADTPEQAEHKLAKLLVAAVDNESVWGAVVRMLINVLKIGPQVILLSLKEADEAKDEKANEIELYVKQYLTVSQEPEIINKIIELNKLPDVVKNYMSLLAKVKGMTKIKNQ
jgi:hypothetical protein